MTVVGTLAVIYTYVRCPNCKRRVMDVPGKPTVHVRIVDEHRASGRGRVVTCQRCKNFLEVIEHR